jgi:transcriptional regulator with GAF, ATPase, and Fis domain
MNVAHSQARSRGGRAFRSADRGTLFLDEIGDLPLELLRVLQEQEFERLGSSVTQRVNVRLIASTQSRPGRYGS